MRIIRSITFAAAMLLCAAWFPGQTAWASYAVPVANTGRGQVQAVNYAARTVTINGHEYALAPKAVFVGQGMQNIGGLHPGMQVRFTADGPLNDPNSKIINVTVLPPESQ